MVDSHLRRVTVYPRVCGGTRRPLNSCSPGDGLSPRVRGNPSRFTNVPLWLRSIPACAGEPLRHGRPDLLDAVYPRVCGGTEMALLKLGRDCGLSPRVRGNLLGAGLGGAFYRSIPACAGEPGMVAATWNSITVYPRVCGGTVGVSRWMSRETGLSPRVRGNRRGPTRRQGGQRSIPACAGEPVNTPGETPSIWVYPRVCGGTKPPNRPVARATGLSPRVRGNRGTGPPLEHCGRSIPACAGEPTS